MLVPERLARVPKIGKPGAVEVTRTRETFREWRPPPRLAPYVVCFWVQRVPSEASLFLQRTVPNGSAELTCTVGSVARLVGPETKPSLTSLSPGATVVGVRLRPEAGSVLLGQAVTGLVDVKVESDLSVGRRSVPLPEVVAAATTDRELLHALRVHLQRLLSQAPELDPLAVEAVRRIRNGTSGSMGALADSLYVSERQLRRRVEAATGLSPKTLHRHLRFQRFLALAAARPHPSDELAELAVRAGYADQAHLTRESGRLEGRSPQLVLRESEHRCRGAHDHAASYEPLLRQPGGGPEDVRFVQ